MTTETFDVLITGAGVTGIGTACHLLRELPRTTFAVLEKEETFGGTWLTNRYPGARSDSSLYTYSYHFKPWTGSPLATRTEILAYLSQVIESHGLKDRIRYGTTVVSADWSSRDQLWTVEVARKGGGRQRLKARFLAMGPGYYQHRKGYTPDWPGFADYRGQVVHPQDWPDDLDYNGRSMIVVGSGSTAATLVPALAETSGPITLLQRSPGYFDTADNADPLVDELKRLRIDESWIHEIARRKSLINYEAFVRRTFEEPDAVRAELIANARAFLGEDYDVATHFTPRYRPWQQRLCWTPGGDLFKAIRSGRVTVVTEEIERFTRSEIVLRSGRRLAADIVVTATGFDILVLGGIPLSKDGEAIDLGRTVNYRGMMLSGVPNLMWTFGYLRASWTLRVDMNCQFLCRLLSHMREKGFRSATPELLPEERGLPLLPWVDPESFNPAYIFRSIDKLPKRIARKEWQHLHDYSAEKDEIPAIDLEDGRLVYA
jgi:cation diffusion facilitator CzcD-associated flavoprotein CzcO